MSLDFSSYSNLYTVVQCEWNGVFFSLLDFVVFKSKAFKVVSLGGKV